jgi:chromosome partitioning protein
MQDISRAGFLSKTATIDVDLYQEPSHMKVVVLSNRKGGVGKTTSAITFAIACIYFFQKHDKSIRVLLIDMDSQWQATRVTTRITDPTQILTVGDVLRTSRAEITSVLIDAVQQSQWHPNLDVLCASPELDNTLDIVRSQRQEVSLRLAHGLTSLKHYYDFVFIDTPPNFQLNTEIALVTATDVVIPVEPEYLASTGLASAINRIIRFKQDSGLRLNITGILLTKVDKRMSDRGEIMREIIEHPVFGSRIIGVIPTNEAIHRATRRHMSVIDYQATAPAARAYMKATRQLVMKLLRGKSDAI